MGYQGGVIELPKRPNSRFGIRGLGPVPSCEGRDWCGIQGEEYQYHRLARG
jgi:hypothetical protein